MKLADVDDEIKNFKFGMRSTFRRGRSVFSFAQATHMFIEDIVLKFSWQLSAVGLIFSPSNMCALSGV